MHVEHGLSGAYTVSQKQVHTFAPERARTQSRGNLLAEGRIEPVSAAKSGSDPLELLDYRKEVERLQKAGLQMVADVPQGPSQDTLSGYVFVVSGVFESFSRDEIKKIIVDHGGKIASSVSGKTNYLVAGAGMGPSKKAKAESLAVEIIDERKLKEWIGYTD